MLPVSRIEDFERLNDDIYSSPFYFFILGIQTQESISQ